MTIHRMLLTKLTRAQLDQVDWALGALVPYWKDEPDAERPDLLGTEVASTTKHGDLLILIDGDVLLDLRYRLLQQLPDMMDGETGTPEQRGCCRAAENAWATIDAEWARLDPIGRTTAIAKQADAERAR